MDNRQRTNDVRMEDRSVGGQCTGNKRTTNGQMRVQTHSEQLEITRNRVADINETQKVVTDMERQTYESMDRQGDILIDKQRNINE